MGGRPNRVAVGMAKVRLDWTRESLLQWRPGTRTAGIASWHAIRKQGPAVDSVALANVWRHARVLGGGVTALWLAITELDNDNNSGSSWAYAAMTVKAPGPAGH